MYRHKASKESKYRFIVTAIDHSVCFSYHDHYCFLLPIQYYKGREKLIKCQQNKRPPNMTTRMAKHPPNITKTAAKHPPRRRWQGIHLTKHDHGGGKVIT